MADTCPYCLEPITVVSRDHIFSHFLGGHRKIRSCQRCNRDTFGRGFESVVSGDLAEIFTILKTYGYEHTKKKPIIIERALKDDEGILEVEYDMDSDGKLRLNKPVYFEHGEDGKLKKMVTESLEEGLEILKRKGLNAENFKFRRIEKEYLPVLTFDLIAGRDMHRLAIKMSVALGQHLYKDVILMDEQCRRILLDKNEPTSVVRAMFFRYPELDSLRPPLAHVIYIEADSVSGKCFGVIQFFGGAFQFYVPLSRSYSGPDIAAIGILDVRTKPFEETIHPITALNLPEAPAVINGDVMDRYILQLGTDLNKQIEQAFGHTEVTAFDFKPKQL